MRPSAMRPLWHPPGHRPGRAPRWPQALRRSPVPAATSLGHEPVLSAAPSRASRSKWRRLARPSSARPVARPARLAVRPHESVGMLIGRHRRYTGYGARGGPPDDPISRHHRAPPRTMVMVRAIEPACAIGRPWSSDSLAWGILTVRNPGRRHVRKMPAAHRSATRPAPRAARRPARRPPGPTRPAPGRQAPPCCRSAQRSGRRWSARR